MTGPDQKAHKQDLQGISICYTSLRLLFEGCKNNATESKLTILTLTIVTTREQPHYIIVGGRRKFYLGGGGGGGADNHSLRTKHAHLIEV